MEKDVHNLFLFSLQDVNHKPVQRKYLFALYRNVFKSLNIDRRNVQTFFFSNIMNVSSFYWG